MKKENKLRWLYGAFYRYAEYEDIKYVIETSLDVHNFRILVLYVFENGVKDHVTGHKSYTHLQKCAEWDLERRLKKREVLNQLKEEFQDINYSGTMI